MTNLQAYRAAIRPYNLPKDSLEFLLLQQGLQLEDDFDTENAKEFYSAVVDGLMMVITLTKEKDAGSENDYDTDKIMDRINFYRRKYDIEDDTDYEFIDRTSEW